MIMSFMALFQIGMDDDHVCYGTYLQYKILFI